MLGKRFGVGELVFKHGLIIQGIFNQGNLDGFSVITSELDSNILKGTFTNGTLHGK